MIKPITIAAFVVTLVYAAVAAAEDPKPGAAMPCFACHGEDGVGTAPLFPHLAGQSKAYLTLQMELFRTGERPSHIMNTLARSMSDHDIEATVTYYADLPRCK